MGAASEDGVKIYSPLLETVGNAIGVLLVLPASWRAQTSKKSSVMALVISAEP